MSASLLEGRRVAVCVGGGIAAYRVGDLVRELRRGGAEVRVAMTEAAQSFITPLTMAALSGAPVATTTFDAAKESAYGHLELARWADAFVIAPATADLLARLRAGMADDVVTTSVLAFRGPVLLAPAMNTAMWDNPLTQQNLSALLAVPRFRCVGPGVGPLADGDVGAGRLAEVREIVEAIGALGASASARGPMAGQRVLITAGPTREALDPVRFLSNPSTGKMGLAVAAEAQRLGAEVTVVLGPVAEPAPPGVTVVPVVTAEDMLAAVMARVAQADVFVAVAAVSDYRPEQRAAHKQKKGEGPVTLTLVRTPDVLATAAAAVHENARRPLLVGFAAETHDVLAYAQAKLAAKRLDYIVANDVAAPGAGFAEETNRVTVLGRAGTSAVLEGSKREVAAGLWTILRAHGRPA